ncbi:hypothetical protein ACHQM5_002611 [Ranunculus cassubicifolius]
MMSLVRCLAFLLMVLISQQSSDGAVPAMRFEQWCIADEQTPDDLLQQALDWACGQKDVDCTKLQAPNGVCYHPNTLVAHASYAFNSYYQKYKHRGASCYFKGAAITTEIDPSHSTCRFEFNP